ncbi:hypothetical protein QFZ63_000549 [Streptomyces sp. B3I7]|uniref:DUF4259 domain-containing protein n=1 Tax=Streptomyces sp. B3I7 TaxID=3042269 RepID=UPI00278B0FB6|nr:DUF4259 domain-containing protein [Streptomyces sp. B3I7]MDQ0808835.1 hypothetical protein [Streptomyces sp. B3I7]
MSAGPAGIEPAECWGVAVPADLELLGLLAGQGCVGVSLRDAEVVEGWKKTYLLVEERGIDELSPPSGCRDERRAVTIRTFDDLAEFGRENGAEGRPPSDPRP